MNGSEHIPNETKANLFIVDYSNHLNTPNMTFPNYPIIKHLDVFSSHQTNEQDGDHRQHNDVVICTTHSTAR